MMPLPEIENRIRFLESEINRLDGRLRGLPQPSGGTSKTSSNQTMGSLPFSLKQILHLGFVWVNNKVNVKPKTNGGITVDTSGVGVSVRANYGLNLDSNGLALKKQTAPTAPGTVAAVVINAGADTIDRAAANTALATQATEIASLKTSIESIITKLQAAEVIA